MSIGGTVESRIQPCCFGSWYREQKQQRDKEGFPVVGFGSSGSTGMERRRKPKSLGKGRSRQAGSRYIGMWPGFRVRFFFCERKSSCWKQSLSWYGLGGYASFLNEMVCKKGCESMGGGG